MNIIITAMKNSLEGLNSRFQMAEEITSELKDGSTKLIQSETATQKGEKMNQNKQNLRDMWDTIKDINIGIMEAPEEEEREKGRKKI